MPSQGRVNSFTGVHPASISPSNTPPRKSMPAKANFMGGSVPWLAALRRSARVCGGGGRLHADPLRLS
ncbi:hypothetical protein GCM10008965_07890 [Methylorubrum aminovorans]|uniref:hypothetical protein n=1 Tax=Methylorubrum aminovorans TaxID=269069 RepID=UPI0024E0C8A6|nr:hypothetical protein [Methylorubrum aminovorans]